MKVYMCARVYVYGICGVVQQYLPPQVRDSMSWSQLLKAQPTFTTSLRLNTSFNTSAVAEHKDEVEVEVEAEVEGETEVEGEEREEREGVERECSA